MGSSISVWGFGSWNLWALGAVLCLWCCVYSVVWCGVVWYGVTREGYAFFTIKKCTSTYLSALYFKFSISLSEVHLSTGLWWKFKTTDFPSKQ